MTTGIIFPSSSQGMIKGLIKEHDFTEQSLAKTIGVREGMIRTLRENDESVPSIHNKLSRLYITILVCKNNNIRFKK